MPRLGSASSPIMGSGPRVADDSLGSGRQKVLEIKEQNPFKRNTSFAFYTYAGSHLFVS